MLKLQNAIRDKSARIGVLGLGYVGLPLAVEFCRKGFRVDGFDISPERVSLLKKGKSYVLDIPSAEIRRWTSAKRFAVHRNFDALAEQDVLLVCVQTPLRKTKEPDITNIIAACREIAKRPRRRLVVLESTTYPGTTEEIVRPILEETGRLGSDFYLAYSPERVDPGNKNYTISNTPKVVGGSDPASTKLAMEVYSHIVPGVVPMSSTRSAEMVKLLENTFRSANIALVNEMAQICHRLGLDVWEIVAAAATKPFGFMPFYPGPGIGGHCIPKDPQLLNWKMKSLNFEPRFIQLASVINGAMPEYAAGRIAEALNRDRRSLNGSRVLVLGVAYKPDVSDCRESPALDVISYLLKSSVRVSYHDPYVKSVVVEGQKLSSIKLTDGALKGADCVAILTAHHAVDYARVVRRARRIFDARNATAGFRTQSRKQSTVDLL